MTSVIVNEEICSNWPLIFGRVLKVLSVILRLCLNKMEINAPSKMTYTEWHQSILCDIFTVNRIEYKPLQVKHRRMPVTCISSLLIF